MKPKLFHKQLKKTKKQEFKYKPRKCKICGQTDFKNPRSLSMHMHIAHKNLDELETQHIIADTFLGSAKLAVYMKQLDGMTSKEQDENETIPPIVKKYWKLARAEKNKKEKTKQDRKEKSKAASKETPNKSQTASKLHVLTASTVKLKLRSMNPEAILGIFIKDLETYHFVVDVKYDTKEKTLDLLTTKNADVETGKIPHKSKKLLTVEQLLYFLENAKIGGTTQFFINSASAGGSKLTKVSEGLYTDNIPAVLFTFEYDKAYYQQYMAKYFKKQKKKK